MKNKFLGKTFSVFLAFLLVFMVATPAALATSQPSIAVGSAEGKPGDTVSVPITVENNPGIVALRVFVTYDAEVLRLTDIQDGTVFPAGKNTFNDNLQANPNTMLWMDGTSTTNYTASGTLATLTFTILESAKDGISPIAVTYDSSSTFNVDLTDVTFNIQNGSVTVAKEEKLYTATFVVDGTAISTKQYHEGETIVKPPDPVKDGYTFKGWTPSVPATMPAGDQTFTARFEKNPDPVIEIHNWVESRTVDYRTTITFSADVTNQVDGASVHWYIAGQNKGTGDTYTFKEAKQKFTVQAKYMKDGKILAESEIETVNVKTGLFAKLKAFFRALFGRLPKVVQEYLGIEIIEKV